MPAYGAPFEARKDFTDLQLPNWEFSGCSRLRAAFTTHDFVGSGDGDGLTALINCKC